MSTVKLSVYITAQGVIRNGATPEGRKRLVDDIRGIGAKKVFIEVWRGATQTPSETLRVVRDAFVAAGIEVATGLMPVRGRDVALEGTAQWDSDAALGGNSRWGADICYSRPWSREALAKAITAGAELFDEFIIDDALCTQCTCPRCRAARGERSWGQFRRDVLVDVCRETIVATARKANPKIKMILKYPQWYDRLPVFGYDTARQPTEFNATWIGTETRDPFTPDFGYVPQYEACFNVRWHKAAEPNLEGAWFDYIECDPMIYVEQAYQSVLGGARNLTLFCYSEPLFGTNDYLLAALKAHMPRLEALAARLDGQEPIGLVTVRPHNPAPQEDGYIFDGLGMLGFPLVPRADWPKTPPKALLVTDHVAADPNLAAQVAKVVNAGGTVFMTAAVLAQNDDNAALKGLAGFQDDGWSQPNSWESARFCVGGNDIVAAAPIPFRFDLRPSTAKVLAAVGGVAHHRTEWVPVVTRQEHSSGGAVVVLNVFGAAPRDFRMDENLNVPLPLRMQEYPAEVVNVMQEEIARATGRGFRTPARVGYYPFSGGDCALENFTDRTVFAVPIGDALPAGAKELLGMSRITDRADVESAEHGGPAGVRGVRLPPHTVALISTR